MSKNNKFLNKKEIAFCYEISVKTLSKILKKHEYEVGKPHGRLYSPLQVENIIKLLGQFEPE